MSFLFGKEPTLKEQSRAWKLKLTAEQRNLERNIRQIEMEEKKTIATLKDAAKKGKIGICRIMGRELVRSRHAKERLHMSKAQLSSIAMQLQEHLSMLKVSDAISKSAQIMTMMNNLVKIPEISAVMQAMGREMAKAGVIEDMMEDTIFADSEQVDADAEAEVDKILFEITQGQLGKVELPTAAPTVTATAQIGEPGKVAATATTAAEPEPDLDALRARLEGLRN